MLHTYPPHPPPPPPPTNQCPNQASTSQTLQFPRYCPDKILKFNVTAANQKSNQGNNIMWHTHSPQPMSVSSVNFLHLTVSKTHVRQDFEVQDHYSKLKSRSHAVTHLHLLTNILSKLFLPLMVSKMQPGQNCEGQGHYTKDKGQIIPPPPTNVPTKYQLPTLYGF